MPQPAALSATMNANIAATWARSRPESSAPIRRSRPRPPVPPGMRSALRPRTGMRRQAGPGDRSDHRVIDAERICQAIAALDSPEAIAARARQFAVLADPTRLTLLTCIRAAGPISVSDLAAATGINDATVSQTLRYLRASQTVIAEREGRVVRYRLASTPVSALLAAQA